ncbi:MAG: hybrid sensor histidine kinase/response regulator, partial [bacterium]
KVIGVVGNGRVVTHQKLVEDSYKHIFNATNEAIFIVDFDSGQFVEANSAALKLSGYSIEELLGKSGYLFSNQDHDTTAALFKQKKQELETHGYSSFEWLSKAKDGKLVWIAVHCKLAQIAGQKRLVIVARDIGRSRKKNEDLKASEERFRTLVESSYDCIAIYDIKGTILYSSNSVKRMLGFTPDELNGTYSFNYFHPDDRKHIKELVYTIIDKPGAMVQSVSRLIDKNGKEVWVDFVIQNLTHQPAVNGFIANFSDITERKNLELQMQQAQKLESLGVLAGGIAHDFNNLLTSIIGNTDLATLNLSEQSPAQENLKEIDVSAQRAADLCQQLLAYSGRGKFQVKHLNINFVLNETMRLVTSSISKKAILSFELEENLPSIYVDETQLKQVMMNLIINASDALENQPGSIVITTGAIDCDRECLANSYIDDKLEEGVYVFIEVKDSGTGIEPTNIQKIFDPFYTTKFVGRGLGLVAVLGIVRSHQGAIKVESTPGEGTRFKILFPGQTDTTQKQITPLASQPSQCRGTVLVVDDEVSIRNLASKTLEKMGLTVLTAIDGIDAIELLKKHQNVIDIILLDMTMPKLDGAETYKELKKINPEIKVILSSGYSKQEITSRFKPNDLVDFLQKPYKAQELTEAICEPLRAQIKK